MADDRLEHHQGELQVRHLTIAEAVTHGDEGRGFRLVDPRVQPSILVTRDDHEQLHQLAGAARTSRPLIAEFLLSELMRAEIIAAHDLPRSVVSIGSLVKYRDDRHGHVRTIMLVYPENHDIDHGRVSVLTSIGAALLGLAESQSIEFGSRYGYRNRLTVLKVFARGSTIADVMRFNHFRDRNV